MTRSSATKVQKRKKKAKPPVFENRSTGSADPLPIEVTKDFGGQVRLLNSEGIGYLFNSEHCYELGTFFLKAAFYLEKTEKRGKP